MAAQPDGAVGIPIVVAEELLAGQIKNTQQAKKPGEMVRFYGFLRLTLAFLQEAVIIPFDQAAAKEYEALGGATRVSSYDRRIAAIAKANDLTVITENVADFSKLGVRYMNWCTPLSAEESA